MTIRISKFKLAVSVFVIALVGAGAAYANHSPFVDLTEGAFYEEPVEWLYDNGLTTGSPSGSDTFKPLDNVTRGEYATFNFRYDDLVVQPALEDIRDDIEATDAAAVLLEARVAAIESLNTATRLDSLEDSKPFAVSSPAVQGAVAVDGTGQVVNSVDVTAPVAGSVTVNSAAIVISSSAGQSIRCTLTDNTARDINYEQLWESAGGDGDRGTLSGTRVFTIAEGETMTYGLFCQRANGTGSINVWDNVVTALFTPAA